MIDKNVFREYDIRGIVGEHLNEDVVRELSRAIGTFFVQNGSRKIALGYDARQSSPIFAKILADGLNASGIDVISVGQVPTPVLYHTVFTRDVDGGVMITGSHNPPDHNGFKICLGHAVSTRDSAKLNLLLRCSVPAARRKDPVNLYCNLI